MDICLRRIAWSLLITDTDRGKVLRGGGKASHPQLMRWIELLYERFTDFGKYLSGEKDLTKNGFFSHSLQQIYRSLFAQGKISLYIHTFTRL
jgi:hypothetical protein